MFVGYTSPSWLLPMACPYELPDALQRDGCSLPEGTGLAGLDWVLDTIRSPSQRLGPLSPLRLWHKSCTLHLGGQAVPPDVLGYHAMRLCAAPASLPGLPLTIASCRELHLS